MWPRSDNASFVVLSLSDCNYFFVFVCIGAHVPHGFAAGYAGFARAHAFGVVFNGRAAQGIFAGAG